MALVCALLGQRVWKYMDPIGAILVSVYIFINWFLVGREQIPLLSGKTAKPEYINRIIRLAIEHDDRIEALETVYMYHYGAKFLVELHLVLDGEMPLKLAHDIGETLQGKLEHLPYIERAFVHADYEFGHDADDEHRMN